MKLRLLILFAIAGLVAATAQNKGDAPPPDGNAATDTTNQKVNDALNRTHFWDCFTPGGNYTVELGRISSVSVHEFTLTGGRVTEVNIDTNGSVCARFYFMEPIKVGSALNAAEMAKERLTELADHAADRTGTDKVYRKVMKDYPLATHAHTVEYRLQNKADVLAIHGSAKSAWMSGQGRTIRVVDGQ